MPAFAVQSGPGAARIAGLRRRTATDLARFIAELRRSARRRVTLGFEAHYRQGEASARIHGSYMGTGKQR
jgi:hypothetical protein